MTPLYVDNRVLMVGYLSGSTTPGQELCRNETSFVGDEGHTIVSVLRNFVLQPCEDTPVSFASSFEQNRTDLLRFHIGY